MKTLYQRYLRHTHDAVFRYKLKDGMILFANHGLVDLLGLDCNPKHLIGKRLHDFISPVGNDMAANRDFARRKQVCAAERRFRTREGEDRWVIQDSFLLADPKSGEKIVETVAKNITALKLAEEKLREEKDLARKYLDIAGVILVVLDVRGRVVMINKKGCEVLGRHVDEITGKPWFYKFVPEHIRKPTLVVFRQLMSGKIKPAEYFENPVITKDGDLRTIAWHNAILYDSRGRIAGTLSSGEDITEKRAGERVLKIIADTSLELVRLPLSADICHLICSRLAELVGDAVVGVSSYDPATGMLTPQCIRDPGERLTGRMAALLGWNPGKSAPRAAPAGSMTSLLSGQLCPLADGLHELLSGRTSHAACRRMEEKTGIHSAYQIGFRKGDLLFGNAVILPRDRTVLNREAIQVFANQIATVIERRMAEEQILKLNEELERRVRARTAELEAANSELESFTYSVSHDLRAPLWAIDGFSEALEEDHGGQLDAQAKDYLNRIRSGTARMRALIDDMLALSRAAGKEMVWENINLTSIAAHVSRRLAQAAPERKVRWRIGKGLKIRGDPHLIEAVMENLLSNAWKFTSRKPVARIEFGAKSASRQKQGRQTAENAFYVCDNGVGFDMRYATRLFGAFQRLHRADEFPGIGVGLATVRRIIHRHGGRVWAESSAGKGATFYFSLPTRREAQHDEQQKD